MRFNLLYYPLGNGGVCQCPVLPLQLLTVCRFIHDEVFDILYSQNKFRILLDDQVKLSPEAVGKMTSLHVRLNTCSCVTNHICEDPLGRCADCHQKCKRGPDPPLSDKSDLDAAVLQRWSNFCKARGGTLKPEMRFTVICDGVDVAAAKQVVQPMQSFPKLTECAIRLGQSPEMDLRQLAEDTVLKLTRDTPAARSKPFRFLDLPKGVAKAHPMAY